MGLLKRLVIAVETIASRPPMNLDTLTKILETAFSASTAADEIARLKRQQEIYNWIKTKEARKMILTDDEKSSIGWGDEQVRLNKLKPYNP